MIEGIPFDYTLSPYTGWTRAHWEKILARLTYGYVLAAGPQGTLARALYPDDRRDLPDECDALESFARIANAWGAWLGNPNNPAELHYNDRTLNLPEILTRALLDGTNPANSHTYWGDMRGMSQHIVEAADFALTLWFSRDRVFNLLTESERAQIIRWLEQVDGKDTYYDNWVLFPAVAQAVRLHLGYPVDLAELDARLDQMAAFYQGDGWYVDGTGSEYELYNAWMFGWHYLLWAWLDGDRRPAHRDLVLQRAQSFIAGFQYFFGSNGAYPAWGRSIVYRFAATACFQTGALLNIAPIEPGVLRRLSSGCLNYFYQHDCIDPDHHFLRQGFHGNFPPAAEAYISPGSPSWACHGLFALSFDTSHPFWTAIEQPLPVERADFDLALPTPGFMLSGRRATGQVLLLNAGSGHYPENPRHNYVSKYGKLVYSTHFPFNVLPAGKTYTPDAVVSLTRDDISFEHRFVTRKHSVAPGFAQCEFLEIVEGEPQLLRVAVLLWRDLQLRLTFVQPTLRFRVVEAPGALGCDGAGSVMRRSDPQAGWEYAEADGRALAIQRLLGYDDAIASMPFRGYSNINLAYPYAEQPLVRESALSSRARSLAAATLLRPAPFDPAQEFSGIRVVSQTPGTFNVTFPDGETAFVSLANEPPSAVELGALTAQGQAIHLLRATADLNRITALGVSNLVGIAEITDGNLFHLERDGDGAARVITNGGPTNGGITLSSAYLGRDSSQLSVRTLDNSWAEATAQPVLNTISPALVQAWARCTERTLVEFRLTTT